MTFDEFVALRLGALLRYATAITCDPHLAEDVVQDSLVRAHQHWRRIGDLDSPEAYVKRMILNEFLSWRRRRAARTVVVAAESLALLAPSVPDHADAFEGHDRVLRLLAGLPPRQRAAMALRYCEGLGDDEIADLLNCRPASVRGYISKATTALRSAAIVAPASTDGRRR